MESLIFLVIMAVVIIKLIQFLKKHAVLSIIVNLGLIAIWGFILLGFFAMGMEEADDMEYSSPVRRLNRCERSYNERDLAGLSSSIQLYNLVDDQYAKYWEISKVNYDYLSYFNWVNADREELNEAKEMVPKHQAIFQNTVQNIQFPENRKVIKRWKY